MGNSWKRRLACLAAMALTWELAAYGRAALILNDHFAYADSTALRVNWLPVTAGSLSDFNNTFEFIATGSGFISANPLQRPATITNQTLIGFNGRSAYRELGQTVNQDFTLTAYVGINAYARTIQIGVGNSAGAGYSVGWNATSPTSNSGNGLISIREQTSWTNAPGAATGTLLTSMTGGSPPTRYALPNPITAGTDSPQAVNYSPSSVFLGYSELKLTWEASTGTLQLFQDGALKGSIVDTTYNSFTRVYMGGGLRSYVDLVTLDVVPEPASLSLGALAALAAVAGRRARKSRKL